MAAAAGLTGGGVLAVLPLLPGSAAVGALFELERTEVSLSWVPPHE